MQAFQHGTDEQQLLFFAGGYLAGRDLAAPFQD